MIRGEDFSKIDEDEEVYVNTIESSVTIQRAGKVAWRTDPERLILDCADTIHEFPATSVIQVIIRPQ